MLPEALERWSVELVGHLLPRHLEIIYEINFRHLEAVKVFFGAEAPSLLARLSLIEEGAQKMVRMASLGVVGSHAVNGVAALHTQLLKSDVFPEFTRMFPARFLNETNGVTPRRWLAQCNPGLAALITKWLDTSAWVKDLSLLQGLRALADDPALQREWAAVKAGNKARLARVIGDACGVAVSPAALFDVQVKRIHEYKRQQLNALYVIHRYRWIKGLDAAGRAKVVPRVVIFGGKAAPSYTMAKRIIRLIHRIGAVVNADADVGDLLKVVFLPNYNVSLAEVIVPANDLSQHISTAGMEASGTSNMKFAMNGGLIIGTLDGANVEIAQEIERDNIFIFGAEAYEVPALRAERAAAPPRPYCAALEAVLADLRAGTYGPAEDVGPLLDTLRWSADWYLVSHDFPAYVAAQEEVDAAYADAADWTRRTILSVAGMGKFSTDRTIDAYAREIWGIVPCRRPRPVTDAVTRSRSFPALVNLEGATTHNGKAYTGAAAGADDDDDAAAAAASGAASSIPAAAPPALASLLHRPARPT